VIDQSSAYQRCTRCVMDTTDPEISFDEDGVCSHCRSYDAHFRSTVEAAARGDRLPELRALAERINADGS